MKNKFLILLKNTISNSFKLKTTSTKKKIFIGIFAIYLLGCLMFTFKTNLDSIFLTLKSLNLTSYFLSVVVLLSNIFSFSMTFFMAKNILFQSKDNDLLLTLPLKKEVIISSRLIYLYLYNFVVNLICLIPGLYIYIINTGFNSPIILISIILIFLSPIIPTLLASLFGYLIAFLSNKFSKSNLFDYVFNLLFIFIYLYILFGNNTFLVNIVLNKNIKYLLYPIYLVYKSVSNPLYIIIFIIVNIIILGLFIYLFKNIYFKLIINVNKIKTKNNYNFNKTKEVYNTKSKALLKKEIKTYFSSFIYVFNTIIGPVILLILGIYIIFSNNIIDMLPKDIDINIYIYFALTFIISLTNTTCCSISMEKQNFYLLKTLPVSEKEIFNNKLKLNILLVLPSVLFFLIIVYIKGLINFYDMYLLFFYSCFLNFVISMYGLLINLRFPMFDALSDQVIVKRSTSVMLGVVAPIILIITLSTIVLEKNVNYTYLIENSIIIVILLCIIEKILLNTWGVKRFKKIS